MEDQALQKLERNMENSTQCRLVWYEDGGFEDYVNVNVGSTSIPKLASTTITSTSKKSGMSSERVVNVPVNVPRTIGAHTSQFQHSWKGPGLSWKRKKVVTTRQLQQENLDASRKYKIRKTK
ncbi:hypothetical protein V6N13_122562 [Hibiscus sabdariffa]